MKKQYFSQRSSVTIKQAGIYALLVAVTLLFAVACTAPSTSSSSKTTDKKTEVGTPTPDMLTKVTSTTGALKETNQDNELSSM